MATPMKDGVGKPAIERLAANIARAWSPFDPRAFVRASMRGLAGLELKARVAHVADRLARHLPDDPIEAMAIVVRAGETWDRGDPDDPMRGFAAWPVFDFVERYGIDHYDASMNALASLTSLFSAEFAIRPFVARYPERAYRDLAAWTQHSDEHVRRLVSEGTRPRLPWGKRIQGLVEDPSPNLPLLEKLKDDPSLYVRRSVANHLNDIAKDHPDRVIDLCTRWLEDASAERRWIVERATRTLVKDGHPAVWGLLGFTEEPDVRVAALSLSKAVVKRGRELTFEATLRSLAATEQHLVIDYAVHFQKKNGTQRPKVFKLRTTRLAPGADTALAGRISFKPISTRRYYPGPHAVEVLVNGRVEARAEFELR